MSSENFTRRALASDAENLIERLKDLITETGDPDCSLVEIGRSVNNIVSDTDIMIARLEDCEDY